VETVHELAKRSGERKNWTVKIIRTHCELVQTIRTSSELVQILELKMSDGILIN
jgi:hypothetical protein